MNLTRVLGGVAALMLLGQSTALLYQHMALVSARARLEVLQPFYERLTEALPQVSGEATIFYRSPNGELHHRKRSLDGWKDFITCYSTSNDRQL
jgi:hypothetical protein